MKNKPQNATHRIPKLFTKILHTNRLNIANNQKTV